jgi:hypothetical protein
MANLSELKPYSTAILAEDKKTGSDYIKAWPVEVIPFYNGNIAEQGSDYKVEAPDASGVLKKSKVTSEATVVAKWIPIGGGNRMSAPDVCAGETVLLYKFADAEDFYWTTMTREPLLRKKEKVMYAYSNIDSSTKEFDKNSSYWFEVDTIGKKAQLHTSKNDGEPYAYDVIIDTKKGNLTITDSSGNVFKLDSANSELKVETLSKVTLANKGGDSFSISNGKVAIKTSGSLDISGKVAITGSLTVNGRPVP